VKWRQYLGEVDYQYTVSCMLLFNVAYKKIMNIFLILLKLLTETVLAFSPRIQ